MFGNLTCKRIARVCQHNLSFLVNFCMGNVVFLGRRLNMVAALSIALCLSVRPSVRPSV